MNYFKITLLLVCIFIVGCKPETSSLSDEAEIIELTEYETFISVDDALLATPNIIRYSGDSTLYVFDAGQSKVLELNSSGRVINEFGRPGRGPGELQMINNFFLTGQNLYIVDTGQYLIHKYNRNGDFISSMDYISKTSRPNRPPVPFSPTTITASYIDNQPFVTLLGDVMISSVLFSENRQVNSVYELMDWEKNYISAVGTVPEGTSFLVEDDQMKSEISDRAVPVIHKTNAFPVNNRANPGEYFLIYTAFPKIVKYNSSGSKLWESEVTGVPENEGLKNRYYELMKQLLQRNPKTRTALRYYRSGVSSENGDLYLVMNTDPLHIHRFSPSGELIWRYKLIPEDEDVNLLPIFDIDFTGRRIFVVTEEAEIQAYSF